MSKPTQSFRLYELLKSATQVPVQTIADALGIKYYSVSVYIHELKKQFKAEVEPVRDGRKVVAYALKNADKLKVPQFRKGALGPVPKAVKSTVPTTGLTDEIEATNAGTVTDRELADIRSSLGLDGFPVTGGGEY